MTGTIRAVLSESSLEGEESFGGEISDMKKILLKEKLNELAKIYMKQMIMISLEVTKRLKPFQAPEWVFSTEIGTLKTAVGRDGEKEA